MDGQSKMIIESLTKCHSLVEKVLTQSGLLKGLGLTNEEIKDTLKTTFWRDFCTSKEASAKNTFVVWSVSALDPIAYGDGQVFCTEFNVKLEYNSNSYKLPEELESIEQSAKNNNCSIEYVSTYFNDVSNTYTYELRLMGKF